MVAIDDTLRDFIEFHTRDLCLQHGLPGIPNVRIERMRAKHCAAYHLPTREIFLNREYCKQAEYCSIYETLIHELAHHGAYPILGEDPHGFRWKMLYIKMGGSGLVKKDYMFDVAKATRVAQGNSGE